MVLVMLKTWFQRQKDGKQSNSSAPKENSKSESSTTPTNDASDNPAPSSQSQGDYVSNTPLQLLSEVATNAGPKKQAQNYAANNNASNNPTESNDGWQAQQPYNWTNQRYLVNQPPIPNTSTTNPLNASQSNMNSNGGAASWNGYDYNQGNMPAPGAMDLEYTMGDGFEQALGITMGYGDFGKYFEDDQFFGGFMDTFGSSGFGLGGT